MNTEVMITELKVVAEEHKNDGLFAFLSNITAICENMIPKLEQLEEYEEIGTVKECQDAMERLTPKVAKEDTSARYCKIYICPHCHKKFTRRESHNNCHYCGQAFKWETESD